MKMINSSAQKNYHRDEQILISNNSEETMNIAAALAKQLHTREILSLQGELGSGKTCFVRGLAHGLGIEKFINSPTFTIVNEYHGSSLLFHIDLYRITSPEELIALGFEELLESHAIIAIEWAERARNLIPENAINISLRCLEYFNEREIKIKWN